MAGSLQGALAGVPGLAGFLGGIQNDQQNTAGQLGQIAQVQQIAGVMQQAQQRQAAMQREAAFRADLQALGPNASQEDLAKVAAKYAAPGEVLKTQQGSLDRQAQIAATREKAFATLAETARMNDARIESMIAATQDAATRTALMKRRQEMQDFYNARAQAIAGEKLFYETGVRLPEATPPAPQPQSGPLSTVQGDFGGVGVNLQGVSPAALAAVRADPAAQGNPALQAALGGAPAAPTPVPSPAPAPPAGAAPAAPVAAFGDGLDARDIRARAAAPAPAAAPAAPQPESASQAPQMPEFTGSPKEVARAKNQWLAEQSKQQTRAAAQMEMAKYREAARQTAQNSANPANVGKLQTALEKAGLPDIDAVLGKAEKAIAANPDLAEYIAGPKSVTPDMFAPAYVQTGRTDFQSLFNITLKDRSGAAVTNQELERLKQEFGAGAFKTPEQLRGAIQRMRDIVQNHYASVAAGFGPDVLNAYNDNLQKLGGRVVLRPVDNQASNPTPTATPAAGKPRKWNPATGRIE